MKKIYIHLFIRCVSWPELSLKLANSHILNRWSIMKIRRCWYENVLENARHLFRHLRPLARGLGWVQSSPGPALTSQYAAFCGLCSQSAVAVCTATVFAACGDHKEDDESCIESRVSWRLEDINDIVNLSLWSLYTWIVWGRWSFLQDKIGYFPFLVQAMKLKIDLKWNYDMSRNETFPNIYFWNVSNYSIWRRDQYLMRWPPSDYLALASPHFNCQT